MQKVGLILEGGGTKGIFTAGVLDCLKSRGIYLSYVLSVSIGTCNAVDYVAKQFGRTKGYMIPGEQSIPLIHWKHLLTKKALIDLDMAFDKCFSNMIPFDYETYCNSSTFSEYVVTNCLTGKAEYLSEKGSCERLLNICAASCSVPYLSPVVMVDNVSYLDGGISDAIPIHHALELGYEKNIVVLLKERGYREKDFAGFKAISRIFYHNYPEFIKALDSRISKYNERLCYLEMLENRKKVLIISPSKVLIGRVSNNQAQMNKFYQQGYFLAENRIEEIKEFIT